MVAFGQIDLVVKDEARALPMLLVSLLFVAQQIHRGAFQEGQSRPMHVVEKSKEAHTEAEARSEAQAVILLFCALCCFYCPCVCQLLADS